jgi:prepilin-type processing-associated H-X9-DG protein
VYQPLAANAVDPLTGTAPAVNNPDWLNAAWPNTFAASRNRVKTFECPSDNPYSLGGSTTDGVYAQVNFTATGISLAYYTASDLLGVGGLPGLTNYVPIAGTVGIYTGAVTVGGTSEYYANHSGAFAHAASRPERQVKLASMPDGTSNTMLFAEYIGAFSGATGGARTRVMSWMGAAGFPTYWSAVNMSDTANFRFSLASMHTGVINVAFGDGSVRTMRKGNTVPTSAAEITTRANAAWDALQIFSGMQDGDVTRSGVID